MKMNRIRVTAILLAAIVCASLALSGCTPRLVGEAKAKEAGLAFINKVFDVSETEATVDYEEREGFTYQNGFAIHKGNEEPNRVYIIKVRPNEAGNGDYYAEVNAVTGEAYLAQKAWELLKPMTEEQQARADELYAQEKEWSKVLQSTAEEETNPEAYQWFYNKFRPDKPMLFPIFLLSDGVPDRKNMIESEYYIVVQDGSIYTLTMSWPSFEVVRIEKIN